MNILQYKGTEIAVELNENEVYFQFLENGIQTRVIVDAPSISITTKQIKLNWIVQKLDNLGNVIAPVIRYNKILDDLATWTKWSNYDFNGKGIVTTFAPSFNGVLAEYFKDPNLYCWNPLAFFTFFQPIIFEVVTTETSATATVINGNEPIEFSIDGLTWQSSNLFEGLTANTKYTIQARNTVDLWISKITFTTLETVIEE